MGRLFTSSVSVRVREPASLAEVLGTVGRYLDVNPSRWNVSCSASHVVGKATAQFGTGRVEARALAYALVWIIASCGSAPAPAPRPNPSGGDAACEEDRECRVIRTPCCDCDAPLAATSDDASIVAFQDCGAAADAACRTCGQDPRISARIARCIQRKCRIVTFSEDELVSCSRDEECEARPRSGCPACQPALRRATDRDYPDVSSWVAVNRAMPTPGTIQPLFVSVGCPAAECPDFAGLRARCERTRCALIWRHRGEDGDGGVE
jgi:hypothetical protein